MRLHRFYVSQEIGDQKVVSIKDAKTIHQWRDVFRYTTGAQVILFDGKGAEYSCMIERINPDLADVRIRGQSPMSEKMGTDLTSSIWIAAALIKNDNFDWILQKTTELGVGGILPLIAERTIKKNLNIDRSKRIVQEAAEQSGRLDIPTFLAPQDLKEALENFDGKVIVCQGSPDSKPFSKKMLASKGKTLFVVGPEGGWSPKELEFFAKKMFTAVSIGENVLRAETAAIAVITIACV